MTKKTKTQIPGSQGSTSDSLPKVKTPQRRKPPQSSASPKDRSKTANVADLPMATSPILLPPRDTKSLAVRVRLQSPNGATLAALMEITGWQAHTVRAVLSRLRKKGWAVMRRSEGMATVYYIDRDAEVPASETDDVLVIDPASPMLDEIEGPSASEGGK